MKKVLVFLLSIMMVVSFAACGNSGADATNQDAAAPTQEAPADDQATTDDAAATDDAATTDDAAQEPADDAAEQPAE